MQTWAYSLAETSTELAKKVSPRLRDSACWRSGEITQPRTHSFGQLCTSAMSRDDATPQHGEVKSAECIARLII